jgi:transposase InsO family protein
MIAKSLLISRSNLSVQLHKGSAMPTVKPSIKDDDLSILDEIKALLSSRPTYGYRRITALLNAKRSQQQLKKINHKRIYRIMFENKLLLCRYNSRPLRVHDGKIITARSNTRWCSDGFYITCDNGQRVQVAFSLDTCDREVMSYIASTRGIDADMVCDLMAQTMYHRFGEVEQLPNNIQWLTDNGPCYVAKKSILFGKSIGLTICTTRPYNPESNGMAEAFVKTFKRDYVWLGDLSDAEAVLRQLPKWFDDYNNHAPHKGLKMMAPRQYLESAALAA